MHRLLIVKLHILSHLVDNTSASEMEQNTSDAFFKQQDLIRSEKTSNFKTFLNHHIHLAHKEGFDDNARRSNVLSVFEVRI